MKVYDLFIERSKNIQISYLRHIFEDSLSPSTHHYRTNFTSLHLNPQLITTCVRLVASILVSFNTRVNNAYIASLMDSGSTCNYNGDLSSFFEVCTFYSFDADRSLQFSCSKINRDSYQELK